MSSLFHRLYLFELEGKHYVTDIDQGQAFPITECMRAILGKGPYASFSELFEEFSPRYKEVEIMKSWRQLRVFFQKDLLFSDLPSDLPRDSASPMFQRPNLFIPSSFLDTQFLLDPHTNFNHYQLLVTLAHHVGVFISVLQDDDASSFTFPDGIHAIPVEPPMKKSPIWYIPKDCQGILLLSQHPLMDLIYFRGSQLPVICRVENDRWAQRTLEELAINSYGALKKWDAICVSASWLKDHLLNLGLSSEFIYVIPDGADTEKFSPMDKTFAKQKTFEIFGQQEVLEKPLIGLLSGFLPEDNRRLWTKLAQMNPHLMFFAMDAVLENLMPKTEKNLCFFGIREFRDKDLLAVLFNALDLFCFPAVAGTPISLALEAMLCGIPAVVVGEEYMPEEVGEAGIFIKSKKVKSGYLFGFLQSLSEAFNSLLQDKERLSKISETAQQLARPYTWDRTAIEIVELFKALNTKKATLLHRKLPEFPLMFTRYYHKGIGETTSYALGVTSENYCSIEEALALDMIDRHSLREIEVVLQHICKDPKKVLDVLERLKDYIAE